MADFDQGEIEVRYFTDLWGAYSFDFSDAIPAGDTIKTPTVRAFIGNVRDSATLASFTEITTNLIDPSFTPATADSGLTVLVRFQYPGNTYTNNRVSLVFELELHSGAKHPFIFKYVRVEGSLT